MLGKRGRGVFDPYAPPRAAGGAGRRRSQIIYYAGQMGNGGTTGSVVDDPDCTFLDTRADPILEDSTGYYAAFMRLQLNGTLYLPAFRPVIAPAQADRDLTIYSVTLAATWSGLASPPPLVTAGAAAGTRTFYLTAFSAADGLEIMRRLAIVVPAGVLAPAAFIAALPAAIDPVIAATPGPWGATVVGCFALASGRIVFTPPVGTTEILAFVFDSLANPVAAERAAAASMMGALEATYRTPAALSPFTFTNWPNGVLGGFIQSPVFTRQEFVTWVPEDVADPTLPAPPSANGGAMDNLSNPEYYYGYSYDHVAGLFNRALAAAAANIQAQFAVWWVATWGFPVAPPLVTGAPVIQYDATTKLFALTGSSYGYGPARTSIGGTGPGAEEEWTVAFNTNGFNIFSSFPARFEEVTPTNAGRDVVIDWTGAVAATSAGAPVFRLSQGYVSTDAFWSPVGTIGVRSSFLGAVPQLSAPPVALGASNAGGVTTVAADDFDATVVDFAAASSSATDARTVVTYVPDANYRFLELRGGPIRGLDMQIGWRDRLTGVFTPIKLPPQASATFVLAFFQEDVM